MKKLIYFVVFLFVAFSSRSQQAADSLLNILNTQNLTPLEQLDVYEEIVKVYYKLYDAENNILYASKGLKLAEKEKNKVKAALFCEFIGNGYMDKLKYDSAFIHYEKALKLAIEAKNQERELTAYMNLSALYGYQSQFAASLEYSLKALSLAEKIGDRFNYRRVLGNIGAVYLTSGNAEKSTDYYKLLLETAKEDDDLYGVSRAAYELGMIYRRQGEWEKALEYAYQSLEIARSMQYKEIETVANQNLAHIYFLKEPKDLEKAMNYAEESIRLAHELGNLRIVSASFNTLANVYLRQKRYQEAENAALKGWEIDSTYHAIGHSLLFNLAVSNLHLNRKDKTEAYLYKYVDYWNQYINKTTQESIVEIQIKYETEKKEMQIAALEEERKLYAIIGIAGAVILILLAGLLLFLYRLNVQKSRMAEQQIKQFEQEKQLVATQALLAGETSERSRLARDLHDGLGGLLSVIKLNLKSIKNDAIPDTGQYDKALEIIDQSISELRRVAHHMMPESLIRYGLKTSLEDFCKVIPGTHFQYVGEDKRLDNRLEVVIYRCAYELINNVIKHANATIINVQLIADEGLISLSVSDNGRGFDTENIAAGSGLENIRTRISAYNGKLNIYSSPGNGTEVNIEIESKNPA